jgi:hypothetical protein
MADEYHPMSDWAGLLPAFAFAESVGLAVPVTLAAWLGQRWNGGCFGTLVRRSFAGWLGLHSLGAVALWWAGLSAPAAGTLFVAGFLSALLLGVLPLAVGQRLLQRRGAPSGTALRYATYGWPPALTIACAAFFAPSLARPGALGQYHVLALGGPEFCLLGFCGIGVLSAVTVGLLAAVVVLCPGPFGLMVAERIE